jgi:hypothetical protein
MEFQPAGGQCLKSFLKMFSDYLMIYPQMVHQLVSMGANNIWEHSLLNPSQAKQGRRKPNPRDIIQ